MKRKEITVIIACNTASGVPEFFATTVEATQEQVNNGDHYELAKEKALENDYERPMVAFDQDEAPAFLLQAVDKGLIPLL